MSTPQRAVVLIVDDSGISLDYEFMYGGVEK